MFESLTDFAPFNHLNPVQKQQLDAVMEARLYEAGQLFIRQHDETRYLYLMIQGRVRHTINLDGPEDAITMDTTRFPGAVLGWSAFRPPHRYMESVVCVERSHFLRLPIDTLEALIAEDANFALPFLHALAVEADMRLLHARSLLTPSTGEVTHIAEEDELVAELLDRHSALDRSLFFQVFDEAERNHFDSLAKEITLPAGEMLYEEGEPAEYFYILAGGRLEMAFMQGTQGGDAVMHPYHTLAHAGLVLGWTGLLSDLYEGSAKALTETHLLAIPIAELQRVITDHPEQGARFFRRILWVVGGRLRAVRVRFIMQQFNEERLAIRSLLNLYGPQLAITSPLRKLPHLLENRFTIADGFRVLSMVARNGSFVEKNLATTFMEILERIRADLRFFQKLQQIYERVAESSSDRSPEEVRTHCNMGFGELYDMIDITVEGEENLPVDTGHIFMMNHLVNHMDYQLPAGFLITMDTHFLTAFLYRKYGQNAMRVVRRSDRDEYEHQQYFDPFNYIYVGGPELEENPNQRQQIRQRFFQEAGAALDHGRNLIICPEGNTTSTEKSPLPFQKGGFLLAAQMPKEPLIVPVVLAWFDKKLTRQKPVVRILKPFHLSKQMDDPQDRAQMNQFVTKLQGTYDQTLHDIRQQA
ncbi:cyclic nucleotide-binding domain-containing protein [Magnetococcus sp. PR-3]|uniref:cyclic nucleotide-binding domain-containing protein n=1 Tax=Magnetococcus sp. PR-3 TaxID=3120355 RepID=UPI002FCE263F